MKKIYLALTITLIIIAVSASAEAVLRYRYAKKRNALISKYGNRDLYLKNHPRLIYTGIPNVYGNNSQGYRDCEHSFTKPKNVYRIVIIGDSVAMGSGVKRKESFGRILEKKMNDASSDKKYEVIIIAQTGYSTSQELILLKEQAFNYNPGLIIWSYILNDPAHPVFHDANGELGVYFYKPRSYFWGYILKKLFYLKENLKSVYLHCNEYHQRLHYIYRSEVEHNIQQIGKTCAEHNVPVIFLIHPIFEKDKKFNEYSLLSLHNKLKQTAQKYGLIPIDLLDAYKNYNPDDLDLNPGTWYDPWHLNATGHKITAEYIYSHTVSELNPKPAPFKNSQPAKKSRF